MTYAYPDDGTKLDHAKLNVTQTRWRAADNVVEWRLMPPLPDPTYRTWIEYLRLIANRGHRGRQEIDFQGNDRLVLSNPAGDQQWTRSDDPELLRIFERLSAGESVKSIKANGP